MQETIFNPDGSVYMTFPPAVESASDREGWFVRHVCSVHRNPEAAEFTPGRGWQPTAWKPGTISLVCSDVESFNCLLRLVADMSDAYGYRPRSSRIGCHAFRWTWERWTPDGTHMSDMIIVSRVG